MTMIMEKKKPWASLDVGLAVGCGSHPPLWTQTLYHIFSPLGTKSSTLVSLYLFPKVLTNGADTEK